MITLNFTGVAAKGTSAMSSRATRPSRIRLTAIGRSGLPRNREKHGSKVQKSLATTPRAQVCGGQTSPHRLRLVVSNSTCPQLSSSGGGTAVINNDAQIINSLDERGFIEQWKQEYPDLATAQEPPVGDTFCCVPSNCR